MTDKMREQFEDWYISEGPGFCDEIERDDAGEYWHFDTHKAWLVWQAAQKQLDQPAAEIILRQAQRIKELESLPASEAVIEQENLARAEARLKELEERAWRQAEEIETLHKRIAELEDIWVKIKRRRRDMMPPEEERVLCWADGEVKIGVNYNGTILEVRGDVIEPTHWAWLPEGPEF